MGVCSRRNHVHTPRQWNCSLIVTLNLIALQLKDWMDSMSTNWFKADWFHTEPITAIPSHPMWSNPVAMMMIILCESEHQHWTICVWDIFPASVNVPMKYRMNQFIQFAPSNDPPIFPIFYSAHRSPFGLFRWNWCPFKQEWARESARRTATFFHLSKDDSILLKTLPPINQPTVRVESELFRSQSN